MIIQYQSTKRQLVIVAGRHSASDITDSDDETFVDNRGGDFTPAAELDDWSEDSGTCTEPLEPYEDRFGFWPQLAKGE